MAYCMVKSLVVDWKWKVYFYSTMSNNGTNVTFKQILNHRGVEDLKVYFPHTYY